MSAAPINHARDPRTRYEGGFDRWSFTSRAGWAILWRGSDRASYAVGENHTVWSWDDSDRLWVRLPTDEANIVYREHELTIRRLRRAVLVVKLINSKVPGEREAARSALQRIGAAITEDWQFSRGSHHSNRAISWFDHPAAVYLAVTQDCRFHLRERERMPFEASIFAELVAAAQQDFHAGRRAEPPRLRPADLVYLQAGVVAPELHPELHNVIDPPADETDGAEAATPSGDPVRRAETDRILNLREAVADAVQQELSTEEALRKRRRRFWMITGSLAASLLLYLATTMIS